MSAPTLNGYVCFYKGKRYEVESYTSFGAQEILANQLRVRKHYDITVMLAEKGGEQVTHSTAGI